MNLEGYSKEDLIAMVNSFEARHEDRLKTAIALKECLRELVELKELKDKDGKTEDYQKRQPLAWATAKKLVRQYQYLGVRA